MSKYTQQKKEYNKEWVRNNKEKARANYRRYYHRHKDKRIVSGVIRKRRKNVQLAGREPSPYCEICGQVCKTCFDHDHITGKFRGWLCLQCNTALGLLQDNPIRAELLRDYIVKNYLKNEIEKKGYKIVFNEKGRLLEILDQNNKPV